MSRKPLASRILRRLREDAFATLVARPANEIGYFSAFEDLGRRTILKGHFISPRFFAGNEHRIRQDLTLDMTVLADDSAAMDVLARIRGEGTAVAVHVRRGDLLRPESRWLLLPDIENYYRKAIERFRALVARPIFWIFSDDPDWCRQAFAGFPVDIRFVDMGADARTNALKEFVLMCQCDNFVIANSAFSWWGAWLGASETKRVIAPYKWDNHQFVSMNDLIPARWEMISW
jgi:hypothetical protein